MEFSQTETKVHEEKLKTEPPPPQELLASITNKVAQKARLSNVFAKLYPTVRSYVAEKALGRPIDLELENM